MIKQGFVLLLAAFLAIEVSSVKIQARKIKVSNPEPYDLLDDAKDKVDELRQTVEAAIIRSYNSLASLNLDFVSDSDNVVQSGTLSIDQQFQNIQAGVARMRDMGYTYNVDVSSCVDIREQVLLRLPETHQEMLRACAVVQNREAARIVTDARYRVEISINDVNSLDFQLDRCATDNILCIAPVVTQADLYIVQLPQNIDIEVDQASGLLEALRPSVQGCANTHISDYVAESSTILGDMLACITRLIS